MGGNRERLIKKLRPIVRGLSAGSVILVMTPALGQQATPGEQANAAAGADSGQLQEIVVTAQRKTENLQNVPIAVTSISSAQIQAEGIRSTADLTQSVSGLNITTQEGSIFPHIRGVGNSLVGPGFENGVAIYIDDVYVGSSQAGLMSLANIQRVEVLKGPQGTLFGRNSTGGLVQVVTLEPEQKASGLVRLGYGDYGTTTADAYVTGGLAPNLAADFAGHISHQQDGYGKNLYNGERDYRTNEDLALRSSVLFTPTSDTKIRITGDYSVFSGSFFTRGALPGTRTLFPNLPVSNIYDIAQDIQPYSKTTSYGASGRIDQNVGFAKLTSITSYRHSTNIQIGDGDGTATQALGIRWTQPDRQISQELKLASNGVSGFSWVVGAYYYNDVGKFDPAVISFFGPLQAVLPFGTLIAADYNDTLKTESIAGYGQATVALGQKTNVTAGLRYTSEKKSINGTETGVLLGGSSFPITAVNTSTRFSKLTWRLSLDHRFSDELLAYASYNRGFKSGGFNPTALDNPAFRPEVLDAYELGLKSDLLDRKLRINFAGYYYNYKDIQVSRYLNSGTIIYNGAKARVYGVDVDVQARITRELTLSGGASWSDSKFTNFPDADFFTPVPAPGGGQIESTGDATGNRLPEAPKYTANATADYTIPTKFGSISATVNYAYNGGYFGQVDNLYRVKEYGFLNASLTARVTDGIEIQLWGKNLTNKIVASNLASTALIVAAGILPPRTYGGTLGFKF